MYTQSSQLKKTAMVCGKYNNNCSYPPQLKNKHTFTNPVMGFIFYLQRKNRHLIYVHMKRNDTMMNLFTREAEVGTYDDIKSVKHIFGNPV
jgi:hypothetical protein